MKQVTLYFYDELPNEGAKERARNWWISLEEQDPAWITEHRSSLNGCLEVLIDAPYTVAEMEAIKERSINCEFTGYCDDALLADFINNYGRLPNENELYQRFQAAWTNELDFRLTDRDSIEETIRINKYEFLEDGRKY